MELWRSGLADKLGVAAENAGALTGATELRPRAPALDRSMSVWVWSLTTTGHGGDVQTKQREQRSDVGWMMERETAKSPTGTGWSRPSGPNKAPSATNRRGHLRSASVAAPIRCITSGHATVHSVQCIPVTSAHATVQRTMYSRYIRACHSPQCILYSQRRSPKSRLLDHRVALARCEMLEVLRSAV